MPTNAIDVVPRLSWYALAESIPAVVKKYVGLNLLALKSDPREKLTYRQRMTQIGLGP